MYSSNSRTYFSAERNAISQKETHGQQEVPASSFSRSPIAVSARMAQYSSGLWWSHDIM